MNQWRKLGNSWGSLFRAVLYPWPILFVVTTALLFIFEDQFPTALAALFDILLLLSSGLFGAAFISRFLGQNVHRVLATRGESAILSLANMQRKVIGISKSLEKIDLGEANKELQTHIDYQRDFLNYLYYDILNSIQDWSGILPSVNLSEYVNRNNEIEVEMKKILANKELVQDQIDKTGLTPDKEREIERLEAVLVEKQHQLISSREELLKALNIGDDVADFFNINLISSHQ